MEAKTKIIKINRQNIQKLFPRKRAMTVELPGEGCGCGRAANIKQTLLKKKSKFLI